MYLNYEQTSLDKYFFILYLLVLSQYKLHQYLYIVSTAQYKSIDPIYQHEMIAKMTSKANSNGCTEIILIIDTV